MNALPPTLILVTTSFPISGDGSEAAGSFVADFAEELAKHLQVRVVAPGPSVALERWGPNLEVYRYAAPSKPLSNLKIWKFTDLLALRRVLSSGQRATNLAVAGSGRKAQILALWALPSGHWARRASKHYGIPYSVWTLGSDVWALGRIPVVRTYLRRVIIDACRCFSDGIKLGEDTRRIGRRNVEFLPSTRRVDADRKSILKGVPPYRLLFLGRWHPNKGVDLLLNALGRLSDDDWTRIEVVEICGGGPMEKTVRQCAETLHSLGRPVLVKGYLDKSAAEAAISAADYLLIPSRIESIPVVFSDAMKLGTPVVSMPAGDLRFLLGATPACGVVAESIDETAFAKALSQAIKYAPLSFTEGVDDQATQFDLPLTVRRLLACLKMGG